VDWFHATEKVWHIGKQTLTNKQERADWAAILNMAEKAW
jgi:hypothetical protein